MTTLSTLKNLKKDGTKFTCLTCYDAMFARMMNKAEIDTILIGDSLGMVVQGHDSTLPVSVDDMAYHTANVARSNDKALILADLPFMSYATLPEAIANSRKLMQAGAHVIKIEGGSELCELVTTLAQAGTPTCVHLGLTPQSVNVFGGYKIQGRGDAAADKLLNDAKALVEAGAAIILLECVPADLAKSITQAIDVPVIGIGAGADTDGQVLVMHDMLGMVHGRVPRFVHDFLTDERNTQHSIEGAFALYQQSVREGSFPKQQHQFD
ncbi:MULTISPECIES: 3-methyl-2-oxobutanoate hydroxymethyltransferase [unclassified Psychrobacter]|uniref:3-methyl-2-oxobutanoate hydroxymethyltransferase n=1 Tax=unclassified Psychrobacter TaxID=196806 RepID=UPI00293D2751|nr:3-methyl-2-oxobutanoate hydroxymethyltransferase [uncultured Psychrobacter sp.]